MKKMMRFSKITCVLVLFLGILLLGTLDAQQAAGKPASWIPATPIPNPMLSHLVKCVDDHDHFYLVGGAYGPGNLSNSFLRYTISNGSWESWPELPDYREGVMAACYQGKIYAAGGYHMVGGASIVTNTLFIYDTTAGELGAWTTGTPMPDVLDFGGMGAWDGKLYVMGGVRSHQNFVVVNRVDVYDIASGVWTLGGGADMPFAASHFGFGAQAGPYVYVVGGIGDPYTTHVNQTQRYDMATNTWDLGPEFTSARANHTVAVTGTHLYAISGDLEGGGDYEPVGLVERLDLSTWPSGEWVDVQDPVPTPVIQGASTCSEILSGGEIWAVGGSTNGLIMVDVNEYRPAEPCVSYGADLAGPMAGEGVPGASVEYQLTLTNTGNVTDYYTLTVTSAWAFTAPMEDIGPISPSESAQVMITVEVPMDAGLGDQDVAQVTATSISNITAKDSTTLTTTAVGQYLVDLLPVSPIEQSGHPGDMLTYTLQVTNAGDFVDSYAVEINALWDTTGPLSIGPLLPGESAELVIQVSIPGGAMQGASDAALITITSQADPLVTGQATLTSTAVFYRVLVPLAVKN